jgi:hypothetical protein
MSRSSTPDEQRRERSAERAADTCRHGTPGCVGPAGFDGDYHGRTLYVCRACVEEATGRCAGGSC